MNKETKLVHRALELVRDGLRSGEIPAHNFDMRKWCEGEHCGTVACISGYVWLLFDRAGLNNHMRGVAENWTSLVAPKNWYSMRATPAQAADAIDRYLAGKRPWPL